MCGSDDKSATAHEIADSAVDLSLRSGVAGNPSEILQIAGEAEEDNALNLRHHCGVQRLDGVINHSGALAVASGNNLGVWALGVGKVEEGVGGADGGWRGVLGKEVVGEGGRVWRADSLAGDLGGAEKGLKGSADLGTDDRALFFVSIHLFLGFLCGLEEGNGAQTMFPDSVEPRAKMKVTSLQAPFLSSSEVADWRAMIAGRASPSIASLAAG